MTPRRGFTLLELMMALTLTAIAAGVAGSALFAARRATETVSVVAADVGTDLRWRTMVQDLLLHAPAADLVSEPMVRVEYADSGVQLHFLSVGVQEPLGTGAIWRVTVQNDSVGLRLDAVPLDSTRGDVPLTLQLPGAHALTVALLEHARANEPALWRGDWPIAQSRPAAVVLSWQRTNGGAATPLTVVLDPLGALRP